MPDESRSVPAVFYHATPLRNWESIQSQGLLPGNRSHPHLPWLGVYISHQVGVALTYAESGFGSEDPDEPWAIIEIDGTVLNTSLFRADDGHETLANLDDIVSRGFTEAQVRAGEFPWWVCMEETGQVVYMGAIPPQALRLEREVGPEPSYGL